MYLTNKKKSIFRDRFFSRIAEHIGQKGRTSAQHPSNECCPDFGQIAILEVVGRCCVLHRQSANLDVKSLKAYRLEGRPLVSLGAELPWKPLARDVQREKVVNASGLGQRLDLGEKKRYRAHCHTDQRASACLGRSVLMTRGRDGLQWAAIGCSSLCYNFEAMFPNLL